MLMLMEQVCCSLPAQERTIKLEDIGKRTKLDVDGVEFLLMKTLSLHLIEGIVDQVDGDIKVSSGGKGHNHVCVLMSYPI